MNGSCSAEKQRKPWQMLIIKHSKGVIIRGWITDENVWLDVWETKRRKMCSFVIILMTRRFFIIDIAIKNVLEHEAGPSV